MIEFIQVKDFKIEENTVISIGKFDGEHRGHKKIFQKMRELAKEKNLKMAIFTFDQAPSNIIFGDKKAKLTTNKERLNKIRKENIDYFVEYPFDKSFSMMSAKDFVTEILIKKMNMKAIVAGVDVSFAYKKSGDRALLEKLSKELDFSVHIIEKELSKDKEVISSNLIRNLLLNGQIVKANRLLGSYYSINGKVGTGNKIGKKILDLATVNIFPPEDKILPKFGVYATKVYLAEKNKFFDAITNVGINPTVENDTKNHIARIETHIFNFDEDLYDQEIRVFFLDFIRSEKKFDNLKALKEQIEKDKNSVIEKLKELDFNIN